MNKPSTTRTSLQLLGRSLREVGLIVLGVLIALGLGAAWQHQLDRLEELEVLSNLLTELHENDARLAESIATHQGIDRAAEAFLNLMENAAQGAALQVPDSLISEVIRGPTYLPVRSSLDAALSSGQVELIESQQVQRALALWSQLAAEALEEERDGRDFVSERLLPYLDRAADLEVVHRTFVDQASGVRSETGQLRWDPTMSAVTASRELNNLLWRRRFYAATAIMSLEALRTHLRTTSDLIQQGR